MSIQNDGDRDPPGAPADKADAAARADADERGEPVAGLALSTYRPPPSPAYSSQPAPIPQRVRPPSTPDAGEPAATAAPTPASTSAPAPAPALSRESAPAPTTASDRRLGWQLLIAGLFLVVVAGAVAVMAIRSGARDALAFGEVGAVTGDVVVRTGPDEELRGLQVGDQVLDGWVVETSDGATAAVELAGGGVMRIEGGTRLRFVDLAVDPDTGDRARAGEPAVEISGGRAWLVPGSPPDGGTRVRAQIAGGVVETDGRPVAIDCTTTCTVEAPTGGVTVATGDGVELTPAEHEVLHVGPGAAVDLTIAEGPSAWARQNLDADDQAGLPEPAADPAPGIVDSAVLDGTYSVAVAVMGPPTGDPIPVELQYPEGETYAFELVADGDGCTSTPCTVPVTNDDGISGTAQVGDGQMVLTFGLPIDCKDETSTSVVIPGIGTTQITATLQVEAVAFDGERWHARRISGTGTVAATMTTTCNAGDVLGTSTSPITIAAS